MSMDLTRIVTFTNITTEEFTHAYGGVPYRFKAGEPMQLPHDAGRHFAKHLARKILLTEGEKRKDLMKLPLGDARLDTALYTIEDEQNMIAEILGEISHSDVSPELSETERLQQRIAELNANAPEDAPPEEGRTKADVIADIEKFNEEHKTTLPVDKRKSMEKLEEQLTEAKESLLA